MAEMAALREQLREIDLSMLKVLAKYSSLTAALRATPLVKCAEFMELAGMGVAYDPTELKEAAVALRALAEMEVSDD